MMATLSFYLFPFLFSVTITQSENPIVTTDRGMLRGSWKKSLSGRTYASFQGIPYASPPIGELRFRNPQPLRRWPGVWDATKYLSPCHQFDAFTQQITGNEDCLFLNVFSSNLEANASLPVVVFIHGGAFFYGASSLFDPIRLMDKDIVFVSMNYRLGALGFISTGDDAAPGNFGLKDQSFALRWVQRNIHIFGGNPNSVTLMGQSAGAASVHYHYLSPWSVGSFHRGVAYSGTAFNPWAYTINAVDRAKAFGYLVGCPIGSSYEMIDCLRERPAEVLLDAQSSMYTWKLKLFSPFTPTAEPPDTLYPFLTQHPYLASRSGAVQNLPLLMSVTSEEGLYPAAALQANPDLFLELEADWMNLARSIFVFTDKLPADRWPVVSDQIKQFYIQNRVIGKDTFPDLVKALTDRLFATSTGQLAQIHAFTTGQPVYMAVNKFRGEYSLSNLLANNKENYGTCHGDDFLHILKAFNLDSNSTDDTNMSKILIDMLYSYASTGVPEDGSPVKWLPVVPGSPNLDYLEINSPYKLEMKSDCNFGQQRFWERIGLLGN